MLLALGLPTALIFFALTALSLPYFGRLTGMQQAWCLLLAWLLVPAFWVEINLIGLNGYVMTDGDEE